MLNAEGLDRVRLVALDVDGTIAGGDHSVSDRTAAAIRSLVDLGIPVVLLTGRSKPNTLAVAREVGLEATVAANNGSVMFDTVTGENVRVALMDPEQVGRVADLAAELDLELTWWTTDEIFVDADGPVKKQLHELGEDDILIGDPASFDREGIAKIMLFGPADRLDAASARIDAVAPGGTRSMDVFYEFVDPAANKWAALQVLLERFDVDPQDVLGLGDGGNDVVWLSRIGHPVAMGNARPEVVDVARWRTGHHAEDGAAEALELTAQRIAEARARH
ncbi:HAD family hydrolase [Schumannella soli]|uniref:HAD family hydrolase n=1 Tax=Schumannella soli TaxID=2590779 RepID=A0A506XXA4_9MICO|nr:HAD family hydrolase [Schumannella soli]TPW74856.1 HAD family hydrolase [Schumannella soli]